MDRFTASTQLNLIATFDGRAIDPLFAPSSVAVDGCGQVYVTDEIGHAVYRFDQSLDSYTCVGTQGNDPGQFRYPAAVCFNNTGMIYVADKWNHRVQIFDKNFQFLRSIGEYGCDHGQFNEPTGIVWHEGLLYVADRSNGRMQVFDTNNAVVHYYENKSPVAGYYEGPSFKKNSHYRAWISLCTRFNSVEAQFLRDGFNVGVSEYPESLVLTPHNTLIVVDRVNGEAVEFSLDLHYIRHIPAGEVNGIRVKPTTCVHGYIDGAVWYGVEDAAIIFEPKTNAALAMHDAAVAISSVACSGKHIYVTDFWQGKIYAYTH